MNTGMRYRNASPGKKVFIILLQLVMLTYVHLGPIHIFEKATGTVVADYI